MYFASDEHCQGHKSFEFSTRSIAPCRAGDNPAFPQPRGRNDQLPAGLVRPSSLESCRLLSVPAGFDQIRRSLRRHFSRRAFHRTRLAGGPLTRRIWEAGRTLRPDSGLDRGVGNFAQNDRVCVGRNRARHDDARLRRVYPACRGAPFGMRFCPENRHGVRGARRHKNPWLSSFSGRDAKSLDCDSGTSPLSGFHVLSDREVPPAQIRSGCGNHRRASHLPGSSIDSSRRLGLDRRTISTADSRLGAGVTARALPPCGRRRHRRCFTGGICFVFGNNGAARGPGVGGLRAFSFSGAFISQLEQEGGARVNRRRDSGAFNHRLVAEEFRMLRHENRIRNCTCQPLLLSRRRRTGASYRTRFQGSDGRVRN